MPKDHDVIIAGGGPAGLSAAKAASTKGGNVLLLELQAQIGGQTHSTAWIPSELPDERLQSAIVSQPQKSPYTHLTAN
ncbi:hypothetical protein AKJ45_01210 [candidate division MSBL1 archaeon SCGC-AAA261F19]|uniref:FAD-dependent oxidoreductase n=1 Tax=candidate division MSBL1 archaeon SCGC-AAA261F19 TaxID=1698275 RepID=A0A133VAT6_9EURY|nr:hypothetical protein AKJ45_01210 [candidate division MSBL1 archaeon SCGC-AAA261F19]